MEAIRMSENQSLSQAVLLKDHRIGLMFAAVLSQLLLAAFLCVAFCPHTFPAVDAAAVTGNYVQLTAADAFEYFAFDGKSKWVLLATCEGEIFLVKVSNRTYDEAVAPMAAVQGFDTVCVRFTGEVAPLPADVVRFGAEAADMDEDAFRDLVHGFCVDTTRRPPAVRAATGLVCAAGVLAAFFLVWRHGTRADGG